jgi:hypothetical protein
MWSLQTWPASVIGNRAPILDTAGGGIVPDVKMLAMERVNLIRTALPLPRVLQNRCNVYMPEVPAGTEPPGPATNYRRQVLPTDNGCTNRTARPYFQSLPFTFARVGVANENRARRGGVRRLWRVHSRGRQRSMARICVATQRAGANFPHFIVARRSKILHIRRSSLLELRKIGSQRHPRESEWQALAL